MATAYAEASRFADLREMLECSAMRFGTCVAIHEKKQGFYQHISYGRLFEEAEALGTAFDALFPNRPCVLLVGKSSYPQTLAFLALLCGAGVPVVASASADAAEIAALATRFGVGAVLCDEDLRDRVAALTVPVLTFGDLAPLIQQGREALENGEYTVFENPIDRAAVAARFPTRGEEIALSHEDMVGTVQALAAAYDVEPKDTFLSVLPPSAHEVLLGLLFPLSVGASVAFAEGVHTLMRNMREIHPTHVVAVPYLAERMLEKFWSLAAGREREIRRIIAATDPVRPLSARQALKTRLLASARAPFGGALRCLLSVGAPLPAMLAKSLRQIGIFAASIYGVAQCGTLGAMNTPSAYCDGAAGKVQGDAVELINLQPDGSGEIVLKRAECTYKTGDRGRMDENGFLHVVGKSAQALVLGDGTVASPEEMEQMLAQSPLVRAATVVGLPTPEGVEPAAMLWPDAEALDGILGENYTLDELEQAVGEWLASVNEGLPERARIAVFALCDTEQPRTPEGAISREAVAAMLLAAAQNEESENNEE